MTRWRGKVSASYSMRSRLGGNHDLWRARHVPALLSPFPGPRGPPAARGDRLQPRQSATPACSAHIHPELVPHESPAATVQDRRAPHSACAVLHPPAGRKPLDGESLAADSRAHRAAGVAPDLIGRTAWEGVTSGAAQAGVSLRPMGAEDRPSEL